MMRFKIHLERINGDKFLPINYQYELSSVIYKIIHTADSDFARFLHDQGYITGQKTFRLFTFSHLVLDKSKVIPEAGRLEHVGNKSSFQFSCLVDRTAEEFIKGIFMNQEFTLGDKITQVSYTVSHIEALEPPVFMEKMTYRCLSPIFIRNKRPDGGEDYLQPKDEDYAKLVLSNLVSKAQALAVAGTYADFSEGETVLKLNSIGKIYKKGITIKQNTLQSSKLIGYSYEFELTAPVELQEIGYYAGFGNLGSQGFGCVGVKN
ncbi:CRISPR-associated endoribonuclease Cas6 [Marivirga sp. S37H4]|uniref:CRISPR-associated endoribonuclease n=1 Tax=Marivirga aurantiaca TaxID=2802615 RepID=A0A934WV77_9BACT|nr:CRISPR-associated endoribonuclease Cas6 [Marivirga aurantiaca]MBK6263633.1 CRISPR-associated endoribonuclease Cas6 [Marivirga aurantiaca]